MRTVQVSAVRSSSRARLTRVTRRQRQLTLQCSRHAPNAQREPLVQPVEHARLHYARDRAVARQDFLKLSTLKPLLLSWLADAWARLAVERVLIQRAWHQCVVQYYDVHDEAKRAAAVQEAVQRSLDASGSVPDETEPDDEEDAEFFEEESDDEDKPAVQIMKERVYGERRSVRARAEPQRLGYTVRSDQLQIVPDSENE